MLLGEFNHSIDEKGRLIIPAKLRDDLGDSFVICNGLEGCLFVYSQEEWNKFRKAAGLEKDVVLVGVQDRIEIWDKALWEERSQISEEDLDAIAERMESIGIRI